MLEIIYNDEFIKIIKTGIIYNTARVYLNYYASTKTTLSKNFSIYSAPRKLYF